MFYRIALIQNEELEYETNVLNHHLVARHDGNI